jgi:hypothetical protein
MKFQILIGLDITCFAKSPPATLTRRSFNLTNNELIFNFDIPQRSRG